MGGVIVKEEKDIKVYEKLEDNLTYIKSVLEGASDIVYRTFESGNNSAALIYIDGMADKVLLNEYVLEAFMANKETMSLDMIKERVITLTDLKEIDSLNDGITALLSGDTFMLLDGSTKALVFATRAWPNRGVGEPSGETVVRGPMEGFTETIRFNSVLLRRRIRDPRLKVEPMSLGERSKTDVNITYIKDIVDEKVLEETKKRLKSIDIDAILDSGYVAQLIEDDPWSVFPQIQSTERPDVVAAALYEGRVGILVDNSPFALIVPATLPQLFQSPDDYYQRWIYGSLTRFVRALAIILAVILPGLYVAVTSFHTSIIPTKLAYSIAAAREGVPFPAFVEALLMEISMALLLESIVRLPKAIGATIGIVGGLVIGQAAVSAGMISPIMVIVVGVTAITSFITSNYEVTYALRIVRFLIIIAASIAGLYGITFGCIIFLIHLIKLKSFGYSYLSPVVETTKDNFKDLFFRYPWKKFIKRPDFMNIGDKVRQKETP